MLFFRPISDSRAETGAALKIKVVFVVKWLYTYNKSDAHHKMEVQPWQKQRAAAVWLYLEARSFCYIKITGISMKDGFCQKGLLRKVKNTKKRRSGKCVKRLASALRSSNMWEKANILLIPHRTWSWKTYTGIWWCPTVIIADHNVKNILWTQDITNITRLIIC